MKKTILALTIFLTACAGPSGDDGANGKDAVIEVIDPCGDGPNYDEVVLRLADRSLIAYFQNGTQRFLVKLTPGTYVTTDAQQCTFQVDNDLNIVY